MSQKFKEIRSERLEVEDTCIAREQELDLLHQTQRDALELELSWVLAPRVKHTNKYLDLQKTKAGYARLTEPKCAALCLNASKPSRAVRLQSSDPLTLSPARFQERHVSDDVSCSLLLPQTTRHICTPGKRSSCRPLTVFKFEKLSVVLAHLALLTLIGPSLAMLHTGIGVCSWCASCYLTAASEFQAKRSPHVAGGAQFFFHPVFTDAPTAHAGPIKMQHSLALLG